MPTINAEVYDALVDARFGSEFKLLRQAIKADMAALRGELTADLKLMRWMIVATFGAIFTLFMRSLLFG